MLREIRLAEGERGPDERQLIRGDIRLGLNDSPTPFDRLGAFASLGHLRHRARGDEVVQIQVQQTSCNQHAALEITGRDKLLDLLFEVPSPGLPVNAIAAVADCAEQQRSARRRPQRRRKSRRSSSRTLPLQSLSSEICMVTKDEPACDQAGGDGAPAITALLGCRLVQRNVYPVER